MIRTTYLSFLILTILAAVTLLNTSPTLAEEAAGEEPVIITLTQTPCTIIEAEEEPRGIRFGEHNRLQAYK